MILVFPARALARGRLRGGAVAGVLLAVMAATGTTPVSAQTFTGEWPEGEQNVTLSVEDQPVREVLRQAAESAGLNVVSHVEDNPVVSVHVRDASFRDVVAAVLPNDALEVRRTGTMVVIRQRAEEAAAAEAPHARARGCPSRAFRSTGATDSRGRTGSRTTQHSFDRTSVGGSARANHLRCRRRGRGRGAGALGRHHGWRRGDSRRGIEGRRLHGRRRSCAFGCHRLRRRDDHGGGPARRDRWRGARANGDHGRRGARAGRRRGRAVGSNPAPSARSRLPLHAASRQLRRELRAALPFGA